MNSPNSRKLTFDVILCSNMIIIQDTFGKLKIFRKGKLLKKKISDKSVTDFSFAYLHPKKIVSS